MTTVRILADDLAGAVEAAAPFAGSQGPVPVVWRQTFDPAQASSFAFDTESRSRDGSEALAAGLPRLAQADLAFKHVDSLLRGNTVREIAACIASGVFRSVVIAPAFPEQQRMTRGGRQYWRPDTTAPWQPAGPELSATLRRLGADVRACATADGLGEHGAFLVDAASETALAGIVKVGRSLEAPRLWVGTGGLARALAGRGKGGADPLVPKPPWLVVVGSGHPATKSQIAALETRTPELLVRLRATDPASAAATRARVMVRLVAKRAAVLILDLPEGTERAVADEALRRTLDGLIRRLEAPATLLVAGSRTLRTVVDALAVSTLEVTHEPMPGVALARLTDGHWPGCEVVAKSGSFGRPDTLVTLAGL